MFTKRPRHGFVGIVIGKVDFIQDLQRQHPSLMPSGGNLGRAVPTTFRVSPLRSWTLAILAVHTRSSTIQEVISLRLHDQMGASTNILELCLIISPQSFDVTGNESGIDTAGSKLLVCHHT